MVRQKIGPLVLIMLFFLSVPAFSETILLKTGKTIEGKLLEKTEKSITIEFQGIPVTYYMDEISSVDGKQLLSNSISSAVGQNLQSNIINDSEVAEDIKTAKPYFENDDILTKRLVEISNEFWSQRYLGFLRETQLKYGKSLGYWIIFILYYFILPSGIILIAILLFKSIKFSIPIPVIIVFGVLINNAVHSIFTFLQAVDTSQFVAKVKTLFPYERDMIRITDLLQSVMQDGVSLGFMKVKTFIVAVIYTSAAFYLLTLHKSARKIVIDGLKYATIFSLIATLFGRASGESLLVFIISLFIAHICLNEEYFRE